LSLKLKVYIGELFGLTIILFIYLIHSLSFSADMWWVFTFFLALSIIVEHMPFDLPLGGSVTIGFPIDFIVILFYGPAVAMCITFLGNVLGELFYKKKYWYKILFNASQYALSAGIAGIAYQKLGGVVGAINIMNYIVPAIICALGYYFINSSLVTIVISLAQELSILSVWKNQIKEITASYIALTLIGFIMAIAYKNMGMLGIISYFFFLFLARRSFILYEKMRKLYENSIHNNKNYSEEVKNMKIKIFLSYSHNDINIADNVDKFFHSKNILLTRDVRDTFPYSSIKKFMDTIRDHDYVIILISDAYLKSINCMYEVIQFIKEKNYIKRTFPIIIDNKAQIFDRSKHSEYIRYWQGKYVEFKAKINAIQTIGTFTLYKELDKIEKIQSNIGDFLDKITDLNCVTLEKLENTDYKAIIDKITKFSNSISK